MPFYRCGVKDYSEYLVKAWNNDENAYIPIPFGATITSIATSKLNIDYANYNSPVIIGSEVYSLNNFFHSCYNFNSPIICLSNELNVRGNGMFAYCNSFNQPLPNIKVFDAVDTFRTCSNLNQPINLTVTNRYLNSCFYGCNVLKAPVHVTFPSTAIAFSYMFFNCHNFNSLVDLSGLSSSSGLNTLSMFQNCYNFNQPIYIYAYGITSLNQMLNGCTSFGSNIIIYQRANNNVITNTCMVSMLKNTNNSLVKRIYYKNPSHIALNDRFSVVGGDITWSAVTNGYYNSAYNIYILSNISDAISSYNNYKNNYTYT